MLHTLVIYKLCTCVPGVGRHDSVVLIIKASPVSAKESRASSLFRGLVSDRMVQRCDVSPRLASSSNAHCVVSSRILLGGRGCTVNSLRLSTLLVPCPLCCIIPNQDGSWQSSRTTVFCHFLRHLCICSHIPSLNHWSVSCITIPQPPFCCSHNSHVTLIELQQTPMSGCACN